MTTQLMMKQFQIFLTIILGIAFPTNVFSNLALAQDPDQSESQDCYTILVKADELYQAGKTTEAAEFYQQCKDDFADSSTTTSEIPDPIYEIEELEGGQGLWEKAQDGIASELDSKIYFNLISLTKLYPQFIPAYLELADFCLKEPEFCQKHAQENQPQSAAQVLERVTEIYPDDPDLLAKKIELFVAEKNYLQASIAARQFALIYDDYPEAENFAQVADEYLEKFEDEVNQQLISQTVVGGLFSLGSAVLGNNPYKSLTGIEMIVLLVQGESGFGQQAISAFVNDKSTKGELIEDPEITEYIQGIALRMTPYMGRDFDYEFYVVKDSSINAFALPGGKVVVNTGAILSADSEAELAGLLGHEISHAVLSHGFLKVIQANFVGSISDIFGSVNQLSQAKSFLDYVSPLVTSAYSREAERQADILGAKALVSAGYSADGLRDFMLKIKEQSGERQPSYLSTHPAPSERVQYLEKMIVDNGYERYAYMGVKRHREIQEKLKNLD